MATIGEWLIRTAIIYLIVKIRRITALIVELILANAVATPAKVSAPELKSSNDI